MLYCHRGFDCPSKSFFSYTMLCLTFITRLVTLNGVKLSCFVDVLSNRDDESEIIFADGSGLELLHF